MSLGISYECMFDTETSFSPSSDKDEYTRGDLHSDSDDGGLLQVVLEELILNAVDLIEELESISLTSSSN